MAIRTPEGLVKIFTLPAHEDLELGLQDLEVLRVGQQARYARYDPAKDC